MSKCVKLFKAKLFFFSVLHETELLQIWSASFLVNTAWLWLLAWNNL